MEDFGRPPRRRQSEGAGTRFLSRWPGYSRKGEPRTRRGIPKTAVPSFFTLMNLFSGFLAVTQVHAGRFDYACWLIVLAGFFDVLDGMMARLTNSTSLFGVELDSLADVISFGLAPSFLVYGFGLHEFGPLGLIVSSLPAVCGAVRLARFNVGFDGQKKEYFVGMPIPVAAIFIVAVILNFSEDLLIGSGDTSQISILIPIVFVVSFLMISNIRFDSIPKPSPAYIRNHPRKSAAFALAAVVIAVFWHIGLLAVLVVYTLVGISRAVFMLVDAVKNAPLENE